MNQPQRDSHTYYSTVSALTLKDAKAISAEEDFQAISTSQASYTLLVVPLFIFFGLFLAAVIIQLSQKVITLKRIMGIITFALIVALTPFIVNLIQSRATHPYLRADISEVPKDIKIESSLEGVKLTWTTGKSATGAVSLRLDKTNLPLTIIGNNGDPVKYHSVTLPVNEKGKCYIEILSDGRWYDNQGEPLEIDIP